MCIFAKIFQLSDKMQIDEQTGMYTLNDSDIQYEDLGVFLSFIKYPYDIDGKELYNETFKPFFEKHKERILKYNPDSKNDGDPDPNANIYIPAGYRMFGSSGLAILSLVDDYSFYSRFFSINHIRTVHSEEKSGPDSPQYEKIKSVVISGVVEKDKEVSLEDWAKDTFLRKEKRFSYIGIIRLKIDYRLLVGKAIQTISAIKNEIHKLSSQCYEGKDFRYLVMDCYDNDEMTVVAFADDLLHLYDFLGDIRSLKVPAADNSQPEKHFFGMTYLGFGYDLQCDKYTTLYKDRYRLNCAVETKPGHRDSFYDFLRSKCSEHCLSVEPEAKSCHSYKDCEFGGIDQLGIDIGKTDLNISGGCSIYFSLPLMNIGKLEKLCKNCPFIRRDVQDIKVSLKDCLADRRWSSVSNNHTDSSKNPFTIDDKVVDQLRTDMKNIGISKMVRDRLLALIEFYNYSCQNILQSVYLKELKPALESLAKIIPQLKDEYAEKQDEPNVSIIQRVEKIFNEEISNLEAACYDRLHVHKYNSAPLEYRGGIQQYLTSFDFAYKQIHKMMSQSEEDGDVYVTITGAERASSTRKLFRLNIHDIVYPELYVASVWKEVANFALKTQKEYPEEDLRRENAKGCVNVLNRWFKIISDKKSFSIIVDMFRMSESCIDGDNVCQWIIRNFKQEKRLLEYYMSDYIVFHFAFGGNFQLMWHFYFKILFQTTQSYGSLNHPYKKNFINMLLRLFMVAEVAKRELKFKKEHIIDDFLDEREQNPFDSIASSLWVECYAKVRTATKEIYKILQCYGFQDAIGEMLKLVEHGIYKKEHIGNPRGDVDYFRCIVSQRGLSVNGDCQKLINGILIKNEGDENGEFSFLIHLCNTYLNSVCLLDFEDSDKLAIKCVPRDSDGKINNIMEVDKPQSHSIYENMIRIPVDTTGGFFVPSAATRRKYFSLRTAFYRSLWNYRYMYEK